MSSAWASATIEEFEQVSLENGTELFRVRAHGRVGDDPEPRPVLACGAPGDPRTYEPLSSGGDRRGLLRLAYAVPTGLVSPSARFALCLPDGTRIDLPRPTPGPFRADMRRGRRAADVPRRLPETHPPETNPPETDPSEPRPSEPRLSQPGPEPAGSSGAPAPDDRALERIHELKRERAVLQQRVAEMTDAHAAIRTERDEALRATGSAQAQRDEARRAAASADAQRDTALGDAEAARSQRDDALREAEDARAQRDAAVQEAGEAAETAQRARADRESVLGATEAIRAEHTRLTRRLRQHEARIELLRADARRIEAIGPGSTARLRQLEAEREQLVGHARALAELLAISGPAAGPDRYAAGNGAAERVTAARERAVRAAHEQAERDLEQMHAHAER